MAISSTRHNPLIWFAQNLAKAGGDVSVSTNAICWKPGSRSWQP